MRVLVSQLSVKILVISQFTYQLKFLAISQLSVNFDRSHSQLTVKILDNSQLSVKPHQDPLSNLEQTLQELLLEIVGSVHLGFVDLELVDLQSVDSGGPAVDRKP